MNHGQGAYLAAITFGLFRLFLLYKVDWTWIVVKHCRFSHISHVITGVSLTE